MNSSTSGPPAAGDTTASVRIDRPFPGVVLATLDRPDTGNALDLAMVDALEQLADTITADTDARVLVLAAAGEYFSLGADVAESADRTQATIPADLDRQERTADALAAIRSLPIPVVAVVDGAAAGTGLSLALVADIRIAGPAARFQASFTALGSSVGDLGASWLLPRLVGPAVAADFAYSGRTVTADEAAILRLVNRVVTDGTALDAALELAQTIAANSPAAVRLSKRALQANLEIASYDAALELENRGQTLLTRTSDMAEALEAFLEKRQASFGNR